MVTQADLPLIGQITANSIAGAKVGADGYQAQKERDAKLAQLIKGKELDLSNHKESTEFDSGVKQRERDYALGQIIGARGKLPPGSNVRFGDVGIDTKAPTNIGMQMTPAQRTAEGEGGKSVQTYAVSGGAPAMQKNIDAQKTVLDELKGGKRDTYDRVAGKVLSWSPTLMKGLAPAEKARMDRVQNAALANIRATDSNPTQVLIDQTLSRAYDPAASDELNIERITADYETALAKKQQLDNAKANYDRTGYVTIGGGPAVTRGSFSAPQSIVAPDDGSEDPGTVDDAGAEAAYQEAVRSQGRASPGPQTKQINGRTYIKVPGGWKAQ